LVFNQFAAICAVFPLPVIPPAPRFDIILFLSINVDKNMPLPAEQQGEKLKIIQLLLLCIILTLANHDIAQAQWGDRPDREALRERFQRAMAPAVGVHGSYDFDADKPGAGIHGHIPLWRVIRFVPSGDLYFGDETTWQANADLAFFLPRLRPGGGLAIVDGSRVGSDDIEIGYNLFINMQLMGRTGMAPPDWLFRPFVEGRWTFVNDDRFFRLALGVSIPIGR
jgi:hypothetical protein